MIVNPEPLTYDSVKNILSLLRKEYDFAGYEVIGRSWTGKAVFSLSIGDGNEKVLFLGGMRGKEQITTLLLLRFFERMCDAVKNDKKISAVKIRKSLQNRKITIVPLVSPDALDIAAKRADGAGVYAGLVARAARVITQSGMPTHAALIFRAISTFATTKSCMTTCLFPVRHRSFTQDPRPRANPRQRR